jgi:hypothetical protein
MVPVRESVIGHVRIRIRYPAVALLFSKFSGCFNGYDRSPPSHIFSLQENEMLKIPASFSTMNARSDNTLSCPNVGEFNNGAEHSIA